MSARSGRVMGVNGNLVTVEFDTAVTQNEVAYVSQGDVRLIAEVIRVRGRYADMQVFESTAGITVGDPVEFAGDLLSVELGPGLLTQVYDGLQNPLNLIAAHHGFFLPRGVEVRGAAARSGVGLLAARGRRRQGPRRRHPRRGHGGPLRAPHHGAVRGAGRRHRGRGRGGRRVHGHRPHRRARGRRRAARAT